MNQSDYATLLESLRTRFQRMPFRFGFVDYPPFIRANPRPQGPMFDVMFRIGDELRTTVEPIKCTFENWHEQLNERKIITVSEPIMPSIGRPFTIIPYLRITTNVLLFRKKHKSALENHLNTIPKIVRNLSMAEIANDKEKYEHQLKTLRKSLNRIGDIGKGIALIKDNTDDNTMKSLGVRVSKRYRGDSVSLAAKEAIERGYSFLADYPSIAMAMEMLADRTSNKFSWAHLFGDEFPSRIIAGFPLDQNDEKMQRFFSHHLLDSRGLINFFVRKLDQVELDRFDLPLMETDEIKSLLQEDHNPYDWRKVAGIGLENLKVTKRLFINYAREDEIKVKKLRRKLIENGFRVWLDQFDIFGGQFWEREIENAIRDSRLVLVCLSNKSISKRGMVQREIRWVRKMQEEMPEGKSFIIPILLEECPIPKGLSELQYIKLYEGDGFQNLRRSIEMHLVQL